MLYTWRLRFLSKGYVIFNLVVSGVEILEFAAAIPWDVLQAVHVLRCRTNGRSITITGPDSMPCGSGGGEKSRVVGTTKITLVNDNETEGLPTYSYEPSTQTGES